MNFPYLLRMTLWLAPVLLQIMIALAMVGRKLVAMFPIFFCFSIYVPLRDVALLLLQTSPHGYFSIYWIGDGISILLSLVAVYEVFWHLVYPYPFLRSLAHNIFKIAGLVASGIAFAMLLMAQFGKGKPLVELILLLERSARVVQVALLISVICFISRLGLTWKHYATGILAGFGIAGMQLIPVELRAGFRLLTNKTFIWMEPAVYNCAVIVWAFYFLPSGKRTLVSERLPETDLARWNEALKDYINK
jgi:hypothetical protein